MSVTVPEVSSEQITRLVADANTYGYGCIPNYVSKPDLDRMQQFVRDAVTHAGNEYVHFNGPAAVSGSGLDELSESEQFQRLLHTLYERGVGKRAPDQDVYQVLRCLSGQGGQKNSLIFHYDSFVVTALLPVHIPTSGPAGDLLMYPNTRGVRSQYLLNAVDKVLLDNPLSQKILHACVRGSRFSPVRVKMVPGNLYFFWGYRSIHANEACDPDKIRATAAFHYANPHRDFHLS